MSLVRFLLASIISLALVACDRSPPPPPAPRQPAPAQNPLPDDEPAATSLDETDTALFHRFGLREPRPRTPGAIRIATYNVENLFDDKDDPNLTGRFEDIDDTKPISQCQAVADAIRRIDADILAVQEIESLDALIAFRDTYLQALHYEHVVSLDAGDERGIEQAVLSRFPIVDQRQWVKKPLGGVHPARYGNGENWYAGQPIAFHRSPLMVTVEVPGSVTRGEPYQLTLLVVHHKSGAPANYWREAESRGTIDLIAQLMVETPDRNLVLLGDFNATSSDRSFQMYLEAELVDVLAGREGPEWISHASGRRIDHILANQHAMDQILPASAFILGTTTGPEGIDWSQAALLPGYASDHYPVVVDLRVAE